MTVVAHASSLCGQRAVLACLFSYSYVNPITRRLAVMNLALRGIEAELFEVIK